MCFQNNADSTLRTCFSSSTSLIIRKVFRSQSTLPLIRLKCWCWNMLSRGKTCLLRDTKVLLYIQHRWRKFSIHLISKLPCHLVFLLHSRPLDIEWISLAHAIHFSLNWFRLRLMKFRLLLGTSFVSLNVFSVSHKLSTFENRKSSRNEKFSVFRSIRETPSFRNFIFGHFQLPFQY